MSTIPQDLKYTRTHEWARDEGDGILTIGITDHAQELLGDIVYIELPETGRTLNVGEECCVVESVKAAADVYSPMAGEVIDVNETVRSAPELVNKDAYGEGWLWRIRVPTQQTSNLMSADEYKKELEH